MSAALSIAIVAHQGGWDEALLVLGPILVVVGLLRMLKKRVERQNEADTAAGTGTGTGTGTGQ